MATAVAKLKAVLGLDSTQYKAGMRGAEGATGKFSQKIAGIGRVLAGAFSITAVTTFTRNIMKLGSQLSDLAVQTQLSTDQIQALEVSAINAGVDVEKVRTVMSKLAVTLGQAKRGMATYVDLFKEAGVSQEELVRMDTQDALEVLAQKFSKAASGSREYGAILEIIGTRSGAKMTEVLKDIANVGLQGLIDKGKEAGVVMDEQLIQRLDKAEDKFQMFKRKAMAVAVEGFDGFWENMFKSGSQMEREAEEEVLAEIEADRKRQQERKQRKQQEADRNTAILEEAKRVEELDQKLILDEKLEQAEKDAQKIWEEEEKRHKKFADKKKALVSRGQEQIEQARKEMADQKFSVTGDDVQRSQMETMGAGFGSQRSGIGVADRQLKLMTVSNKTQARMLDIEEKMLAELEELNESLGEEY